MNKLTIFMLIMLFGCLLYSCGGNGGKSGEQNDHPAVVDRHGKNGIVKEYHPNGKVSKQMTYLNDTLNGLAYEYTINGELETSGFFWKGKPVGAITYYHNSKMVLYNERDLSTNIYYVIKYDANGNINKEAGVAISPFIEDDISSDTLSQGRHFKLYFSFAEPPGYENHLQATINGETVMLNRLSGHLILLDTSLVNEGNQHIVVSSQLFKNGDLFKKDSVEKNLFIIR